MFLFSALLYLLMYIIFILYFYVFWLICALLMNLYRYYFFINAHDLLYIMFLCTHTFPVSQSINYGMNFRKHVINSPWERLYIFYEQTYNEWRWNFLYNFLSLFFIFTVGILWINIQMNNLNEVELLNVKQ